MMQIAFILLCFALMTHLSVHWYSLNSRLREEARVRKAVDWTQDTTRARKTAKKPLLKRLGLLK
jgi:hypothetical protein